MIPTNPVPFWQYFDLITLTVFLVVTPLLVLAQRRKTGAVLGTISQSVAHSRRSSLVFSIMMTIFFPLYYTFVWQWVGPLVDAPKPFYYLLAFSALCEMVFVWAPATAGRSRKIHETAAYIVGVAMYVLITVLVVYAHNLSILSYVSSSLFLISPFVLLPLMVFKKLRVHTFLYETIYSVAFLLTLSLVAHT